MCSVLLLLFGIVILYICLVHFIELPSSRVTFTYFHPLAAFPFGNVLYLLLSRHSSAKRQGPLRLSFCKSVHVFLKRSQTPGNMKEHFGVAGSGFLIIAICLELLEVSLQSLALFRYAASRCHACHGDLHSPFPQLRLITDCVRIREKGCLMVYLISVIRSSMQSV